MSDNNNTNTKPSDGATQDIVAKTKAYLEQKKVSPPAAKPALNLVPSVSNTSADMPGAAPVASTPVVTQPSPATTNTKSNVSVRGMTNIVDALFTKGLIDQDALRSIKFESITSNISPVKVILNRGLVTEDKLQELKAEIHGLGFIDLRSVTISNEILNKIPKDIATRNLVVAFDETSTRVKVAMEDPLDLQKVKFVESLVGKRIDTYYASAKAIQEIVDTRYGAQIGNEVDKALEDIGVVDIQEDEVTGDQFDSVSVEGAPVSKIVKMILDYAIKHSASDIHIEPRETRLAVRFRIHGILAEKLTLPLKLANSIAARIKILSNMKIDEHRIPQDNRFQVKTGDRAVDIRVSVMPGIYGEKVVMRLLEKDKGITSVNDLGMRGPSIKAYRNGLSKTQGIILITGPTGSGKTVTLASSLAVLNTQEVNILTLEDPVEIRIDGITQVQVNSEVGLTFASGLRSFLRQDPDIIMVGEIRDGETANLAVQAALTGHLVLATLHTNSAAGALPRLLDIGVEPYLLSSTINVVCAQRLVRKLCPECKKQIEASAETVDILHTHLDGLRGFDLYSENKTEKIHFDSSTETVKLYEPVGCPKCNNEGYEGRVGIFEVLSMSETLGKLVMKNATTRELHTQAVKEGMITMAQDGFMKALEGLTTVEEVLRVQNV